MQKFTCLFALLVVQGVFSQEISILDEDTGEPIPNVAVFNFDRSETAISDNDGKCNLGQLFGAVFHLNCHSMPASAARASRPADIVLGDRDGTTCDAAYAKT
jgi:hypothetical protein